MTYGRLDVFLPDGQFKTFTLSDESVSIGRSSGSTIALDTEALSRYHASVTYQNGEVFLTDLDSVNGTFVDGVRLEANQPHVLYGGEEITIGDLRMIFQSLDDSPTRPILVLEDATRRLERAELPFYVEIEQPEHAIPPGAHISSTVTITNTGGEPRRFRVEVSGLPEGWARLDRREIDIPPGDSGSVVVNFKPRRRSASTPGDYSVTLTISETMNPDMRLSGVVILRVLAFGGFGMALDSDAARAGTPLRLHLQNQGSAPLALRLIVRDIGETLRLRIEPAQVTLPPGGRATAQIAARPRRTKLFGDAQQHTFDVIARSGDAAAFMVPLRATLEEHPPLPGWAAFVLGGLGIAIAALMLVGLVLLLQPPPTQPVIDSFILLSDHVAQDEPLRMQWETTAATSIRFLVDDLEIRRTGVMDGEGFLDTRGLSGDHVASLVASQGSAEARMDLPFRVYIPLEVESFDYSPRPVVLYVAQSLTLEWNVSGAAVTRITGLENFTIAQTDTSFGPGGSLTISGIPTAPLTAVLYAEGDQSQLETRLPLEVIAPQCSPMDADVPLRALPVETGQVVGTIPRGTTVVVDAQDALGRWLRVQLSGGAHGWGLRSALTCAETFSPDDLVKELVNLPPTPGPGGTITPPPIILGTESAAAQLSPLSAESAAPAPATPTPAG
ncbi:MAG: FHA domain-containing protein [Anaerolineae bacterium]|nr:FHA domain-containing protein [Anaerolineae bacterium]NUQ03933.1 FHA domain-containing protein [Anaerolineae bacterium]